MQKRPNSPVLFIAATFATLRLLFQSQIPNCPENGKNHHFLASTQYTIPPEKRKRILLTVLKIQPEHVYQKNIPADFVNHV